MKPILDKERYKQEGRLEVINLLHQYVGREFHKGYEVVVFKVLGEDWQAKLKEWGL